MDVKIDSSGVYVGSKHYIGSAAEDSFDDIGTRFYDGKILWYPDGRHQIVKASKKVFRVPVPGVLPKRRVHYDWCSDYDDFDDFDSDPRSDERSEREREDNLNRAKTRVKQIIMLNEFKYFITLTFDDSVVNAADTQAVIKRSQVWLKNMRQRHNFAYLLVPEYHRKKNRIHLHLLANGDDLNLGFDNVYKVEGFKKPMRMAKIKRRGLVNQIVCPVYNLKDWKFGLSTVMECYGENYERLSNYVLKEYVTKNTASIFGKFYWCSKNLKLYPDIELFDLDFYEFDNTVAKRYYVRNSPASFKYINRLGYNLED